MAPEDDVMDSSFRPSNAITEELDYCRQVVETFKRLVEERYKTEAKNSMLKNGHGYHKKNPTD